MSLSQLVYEIEYT